MGIDVTLEEVTSMDEHIDQLSELLVQVVEDGASIGFLPPLKRSEAKEYWETVLKPDVILYVAKVNNEIVGSVQLHLCTKQNGLHRAEIAKLMTHPNVRRQGIGRSLMQKAEERAKQEGRSLWFSTRGKEIRPITSIRRSVLSKRDESLAMPNQQTGNSTQPLFTISCCKAAVEIAFALCCHFGMGRLPHVTGIHWTQTE